MSATAKNFGRPRSGRILVKPESDRQARSTIDKFVLAERHLNFSRSQNARLVFRTPQRKGLSALNDTTLRRIVRSIGPKRKESRVKADYSLRSDPR